MTSLEALRVSTSRDALLTPKLAARLIGGRGALRWIRQHVQLRQIGDRELVLWGDVVDASTSLAAAPPKPLATVTPTPLAGHAQGSQRRSGRGGLHLESLD